MTTIKDIAEYTGVSATTVSNVIHGKKNRVSPDTIKKIEDAIEELHYVPNLFARSLVSSSSKVVAFITNVPTSADRAFFNESFQMIFLSTLESILRENGYYLMFRCVETADELRMFLRNWNVDGLFVSGIVDQDFIDAVKQITVPTVMVDSYCSAEDLCDVGHDDDDGGYQATKYLIDNGHSKIAFTTSNMREGYVMSERLKGYKAALTEAGIPYASRLVMEAGVDLESCRKLAKDIVAIGNVTGIVATTDIMAAGLITALRELGLSVPEDISIVGFDDAPISHMTVPPLTTIRQDMIEKVTGASEIMIRMLNGEKVSDVRKEFPVSLVVRDSVKKIN